MVQREILTVFEGNQKGAKSPKLEKPRPPKLVCMRFMSTSTCMNFLSQFYFLTPMDYSPWSKREFLHHCKLGESIMIINCNNYDSVLCIALFFP